MPLSKTLALTFTLLSISPSVTSSSIFQSERGPLTSLLLFEQDKLVVGGKDSLYECHPEDLSTCVLNLDTRCMNQTCNASNMTSNDVSILDEFRVNGTHYILFCGTENRQQCYTINTTHSEQTRNVNKTLGSNTSAFAVKVEEVSNRNNYIFFFSAVDGRPNHPKLAVWGLLSHIRPFGFFEHSHGNINMTDGHHMTFVYGFKARNHVYMLLNDRYGSNTNAYIIRAKAVDLVSTHNLNDKEVMMMCGDSSFLESAYYHTIAGGAGYVLASFSSKQHSGSTLCAFSLSTLEKFKQVINHRSFSRSILTLRLLHFCAHAQTLICFRF